MKMKITSMLMLFVGFFVGDVTGQTTTIDFNELNLEQESFFNGYGFGATTEGWTSQNAKFNTKEFGPGWSYSNIDDTTTAGFMNQFAAITGTGVGGNGNYAIGTSFDPNGALINLTNARVIETLFVTNTTYAALSMANGDQFTERFGGNDQSRDDPDFFKVTFTGFLSEAETGSVDFYLSDYRFPDNASDYIVDKWTLVNLQALGLADSIGISFEGSRNDPVFGLSTPAYVAIDNLVFSSAPEPSVVGMLVWLALGGMLKRRRSCRTRN